MVYCYNCGTELKEEDAFCYKCGEATKKTDSIDVNIVVQEVVQEPLVIAKEEIATTQTTSVQKGFSIPYYKGVQREFPFMGRTLVVSSGMDTFNYYRQVYRQYARRGSDALKNNYLSYITNLDIFLKHFFPMYLHYRKPLIEATVQIFPEAGIYDISQQMFEEQHTNDFCLCADDVRVMIDSFNKTIEMNQQRKIRNYNMMPGMVFRGLGGIITAAAFNVAITNIAESDIRNANVTPAQRKELFARINVNNLTERAYLDYWRCFLSLTWWMKRRGLDVWYPNEEDNQKGKGLFQNLCAGKLPEEKNTDFLITLLQLNPYNDEYFKYILWKYGRTEEVVRIIEYFGFTELLK